METEKKKGMEIIGDLLAPFGDLPDAKIKFKSPPIHAS
jgi:hypothetical protein